MNEVDYLIISSSIDYSTDLICYELYERKVRYIRLNRDHFSKYKILYNLQNATMTIYMDDDLYVVSNRTLKGIYFRAPVFYAHIKNMICMNNYIEANGAPSFVI